MIYKNQHRRYPTVSLRDNWQAHPPPQEQHRYLVSASEKARVGLGTIYNNPGRQSTYAPFHFWDISSCLFIGSFFHWRMMEFTVTYDQGFWYFPFIPKRNDQGRKAVKQFKGAFKPMDVRDIKKASNNILVLLRDAFSSSEAPQT